MILNWIKKRQLVLSLLILILTVSFTSSSNATPKEISWDDLIPWTAVFDPSEVKFNEKLNNKEVKIPGYIIPLE